MNIPILIEHLPEGSYRVTSGAPLSMSAEAPSRDAAIQRLREKMQDKFSDDVELGSLELGSTGHPLKKFAGSLKGTVQDCSHCGSYVDVGDIDWPYDVGETESHGEEGR